jgi:hypothetical protein
VQISSERVVNRYEPKREDIVSRRTLLVLLAGLAWSAVLAAQSDPFLGIWDINLAKSSITRGAPPKFETVVNVAETGGFRSLLAVVTDRSTSVEIHHYNFDGEFHQTEAADPRELSFKRIDRRTIVSDTRRNGQITVTRRFELAQDGKTMTVTASGTTGGGQKYTNDTRIYDKK